MSPGTEAMVTRQVELTEEQNETLEEIAASKKRSVSELIRAGVDIVIKKGDSFLFGQVKVGFSPFRERVRVAACHQ
jgi:hypothetical protein